MNKPVYLGLPILEISITGMYDYWYGYSKSKFEDKAKIYYKDTVSFTVHVKSEGVYADLAGAVESLQRSDQRFYLTDNACVDKKAKGTKNFLIKREIKFQNY